MPLKAKLRPRRWALAAAAVVGLSLGVGWWVSQVEEPGDPVTAGAPALPGPAVAPPATDSAVPPPLVPGPLPVPPPDATPAPPAEPQAFVPPLLSDDKDLSHARRAGLHEAENPLRLTASAVVVMHADTGRVLYERNPLAILPIASLTKLMTGIVVLESGQPLSRRIRIEREDVDTLRNSRSRLPVGTSLTRREALRLALMSSENRATHALARTYPGGVDAFVAAMNAKARELGMDDSIFVGPTGLSNGDRATARDVATLVAAASKQPLLRDFSTTRSHQAQLGGRQLRYLNSNRLLRESGWNIQLQKTGYILEAGQCLAMTARIAGEDVVVVLLDAGSSRTRGEDAENVRRWVARQVRDEGGELAREPAREEGSS